MDVNSDHLAVAEIDRHGNLIDWWQKRLTLRGKRSGERRALILEWCAQVAEFGRLRAKPVVIERLDFVKKKSQLEAVGAGRTRELSSLAYFQILSCLRRTCVRRGVEVIERSAAYTSRVGAVNYAARYGVTVRVGATCAIARGKDLVLLSRPYGREARLFLRDGRQVRIDTRSTPFQDRTRWS